MTETPEKEYGKDAPKENKDGCETSFELSPQEIYLQEIRIKYLNQKNLLLFQLEKTLGSANIDAIDLLLKEIALCDSKMKILETYVIATSL